MTKQEINTVAELLMNYEWKRGSPQLVVLKHLWANPSKKLHTKDRRMLNMIRQKARAQEREQVVLDAKRRRNERRENRQIAAIRAGQ